MLRYGYCGIRRTERTTGSRGRDNLHQHRVIIVVTIHIKRMRGFKLCIFNAQIVDDDIYRIFRRQHMVGHTQLVEHRVGGKETDLSVVLLTLHRYSVC